MNKIEANNFNELFISAIYTLHTKGEWTKPRGFKCKELIAPQLVLTNPFNCLCTIKDRKLNYAYLIIEKFSYLSQISVPNILISYNAKMKDYINPKSKDFDGAYGPRIGRGNQLEHAFKLLSEDKDTRQAVITINDWTDRKKSADKPCTLSLQFLIRQNKLHLIVNMRSNDILWGLCLDCPAFAFIQEVMLYWLKEKYKTLKIGNYIHNAGSFHFYDYSEKQLLNMLKLDEQEDYKIVNLNSINNKTNPKWNVSKKDTKKALKLFWKEEKNVREKLKFNKTGFNCIDEYLNQLLNYWTKKYEQRKIGA